MKHRNLRKLVAKQHLGYIRNDISFKANKPFGSDDYRVETLNGKTYKSKAYKVYKMW